MSATLLEQDILFYQRFLKVQGYYTKNLDGKWGAGTHAADLAFEKASADLALALGTFDARTERCIATLMVPVQRKAREFMQVVQRLGLDARIISGTRTYEEQNALYRQGRFGNPGSVVTKARGGQSNHNFGLAWDVGIFQNGKYVQEAGPYQNLGNAAMPLLSGISWGGHWRGFVDLPHYEIRHKAGKIDQVRLLFEQGQPFPLES